jgi:hypothetical protein
LPKRQAQLVDDRPRNFVQDDDDVIRRLEMPIELPRPQRHVTGDFDQLSGDPLPRAGSKHRPLEDQCGAELVTNLAQVSWLVLERERRRSRSDL